jgi:hypothetical protein
LARESKQKTKPAYFEDARKKFPDLPRKSFNRVWDAVVPEQ